MWYFFIFLYDFFSAIGIFQEGIMQKTKTNKKKTNKNKNKKQKQTNKTTTTTTTTTYVAVIECSRFRNPNESIPLH